MFKYLEDNPQETVTVFIEGSAVNVPRNTTVATAVLVHGMGHTRTTAISHSPRAPFCMMGACYECLMTINGKSNCQACMETVEEGMQIERQQGTGLSPL